MIVIKVWCQKAKTTAVFPAKSHNHIWILQEKKPQKGQERWLCWWKTPRPQPRLLFSFALLNNFGFLRSLSGLAVVRVAKCFLFHNRTYLNNGSVEALNLGTTQAQNILSFSHELAFSCDYCEQNFSKKKSFTLREFRFVFCKVIIVNKN